MRKKMPFHVSIFVSHATNFKYKTKIRQFYQFSNKILSQIIFSENYFPNNF